MKWSSLCKSSNRVMHRNNISFATLPALLLLSMFVCKSGFAEVEIVHAVYDLDYMPYQRVEDGRPVGPDSDLLRAIFARIPGYRLRFEIRAVNRVLVGLRSGEVDTAVGFVTEENLQYTDFVDIPLHLSEMRVAVMRNSGVVVEKASDLYSLSVGSILGAAIDEDIANALGNDDFLISRSVNYETQLKMLRSGRLDAVIANRDVIRYYARLLGIESQLRILPLSVGPVRKFQLGVSRFSKKFRPEEFKPLLRQAMQSMHDDGSWERILGKYYGVSETAAKDMR